MPALMSPQIETVASLADRCDGCGFAAKLAFDLTSGGSLAMCGHHANRNSATILRTAVRIRVTGDFPWSGSAPSA